jgi:hypothetical protein
VARWARPAWQEALQPLALSVERVGEIGVVRVRRGAAATTAGGGAPSRSSGRTLPRSEASWPSAACSASARGRGGGCTLEVRWRLPQRPSAPASMHGEAMRRSTD